MAHEFVVMVNGQLQKYTQYEDIPVIFDHVIKFNPETPKGPHTAEQHAEIAQWNVKLQELMKKEI